MELPRNITQIGEADSRCKVYVEDYVISYIRQMNHLAESKEKAVALYGVRREEKEVSYFFFYGACELGTLSGETRHLSQAQNQEIDKLGKRYFPDYEFLGYRLLDGEMVEGFHICEQGICRYISGYACFYEKNDSMLAYMLDSRQEKAEPETVNQEKYDLVRRRQEERRAQYEESTEGQASGRLGRHSAERFLQRRKPEQPEQPTAAAKQQGVWTFRILRASMAAVFVLLCVLGIAYMNGYNNVEDIRLAAKRMITEFTEQKIPDSDGIPVMGDGQNVLVAENKLAQAIQGENKSDYQNGGTEREQAGIGQNGSVGTNQQDIHSGVAAENDIGDGRGLPGQAESEPPSSGQTPELPEVPQPEAEPEVPQPESPAAQESEPEPETVQTAGPVSYIIQKGDTLTSISIRNYGTDARVKEICELNNITDPDNIRFGQKILIP